MKRRGAASMRFAMFSLPVFVASSVSASDYKLTARDVDLAKLVWQFSGVGRSECDLQKEIFGRVVSVYEEIKAAGKATFTVANEVGRAQGALDRCAMFPWEVSPRISGAAKEIRRIDPTRIAAFFGGAPPTIDRGYERYFLGLRGLSKVRGEIDAHRALSKWARTLLQPCLGDEVLKYVVSATMCEGPKVSASQDYVTASTSLDGAKSCAANERSALQKKLGELNARAKATTSCKRKAAKSTTLASLCRQNPKLRDSFAPTICALAAGK